MTSDAYKIKNFTSRYNNAHKSNFVCQAFKGTETITNSKRYRYYIT